MTVTDTITVLDARTVEQLQPPCDQHKPGTLEPCPNTAAWIVRIVSRFDGHTGPPALLCDDHLTGLKQHMATCPVHSILFRLTIEPLR